mmetsp:Transcript_12007/g.43255  ORF Transcript_12007/g.43255 Transcript_12007/m.43255 type:complete len:249 (+) Transcript_12007:1234-1980(+)
MHGRTSEAQAARDGRPRGPRRGAGRVQGPPEPDLRGQLQRRESDERPAQRGGDVRGHRARAERGRARGVRDHHARVRQRVLVLHRAVHARTRAEPRPGVDRVRGPLALGARRQGGDAAGAKREQLRVRRGGGRGRGRCDGFSVQADGRPGRREGRRRRRGSEAYGGRGGRGERVHVRRGRRERRPERVHGVQRVRRGFFVAVQAGDASGGVDAIRRVARPRRERRPGDARAVHVAAPQRLPGRGVGGD